MNSALEYALGVTGWMYEKELAFLAQTAAALKPGAVWLEVGTWMGRSWSAVALSLPPNSRIISVDTFQSGMWDPTVARILNERGGSVLHDFMNVLNEVRTMRPDLVTQIIMKPSVEAAEQVPDGSCDVVFIDADHRTPGVADDLRVWRPKLKVGGLLCGHDGNDASVIAALKGLPYKCDPSVRGSVWCL